MNLATNTVITLPNNKELQLEYIGNWIWRSVASLIDTKDFNAAPRWIAERLNIRFSEVIEALDGLERLGIIGRTKTGYKKLLKYVYFSDRDLDPKSVLSDHVLISTQIMGRLNPLNPKIGCFYRTGFVATNQDLAKKYFLKMESLMKDFLMESANCSADTVYAFTLSGVDIIDPPTQQGEKNEHN